MPAGSTQLDETLVNAAPVAAYPDQFVLVVVAFLVPVWTVRGPIRWLTPPGWTCPPDGVCGPAVAGLAAVAAEWPDAAA